jgi:hypothetical protein
MQGAVLAVLGWTIFRDNTMNPSLGIYWTRFDCMRVYPACALTRFGHCVTAVGGRCGGEGALQIASPGPSTHVEACKPTRHTVISTARPLLTTHFDPARLARTALSTPETPAAVSTVPLKLGRGV